MQKSANPKTQTDGGGSEHGRGGAQPSRSYLTDAESLPGMLSRRIDYWATQQLHSVKVSPHRFLTNYRGGVHLHVWRNLLASI